MNLKLLVVGLVVAIFLSGCAQNSTDKINEATSKNTNQTYQDSSASWSSDKIIQFNKNVYDGSDVMVAVGDIQEQLGVIEYSSKDESDSNHDNFSNYYPVGTKLYKIKDYSAKDAFAIEIGKDTFVLAKARNE